MKIEVQDPTRVEFNKTQAAGWPPRKIVIDLSLHLLSTLLFAALIYRINNSLLYAGIVVLGGVFIDLDHLLDYFFFFKNEFVLSKFLKGLYLKSGKIYLLLHSWELNFIILMLALSFKSSGLFIFFLSLSVHLAIDNVQRKNPCAYFLIYRFFKNFDVNIILPEEKALLDGGFLK